MSEAQPPIPDSASEKLTGQEKDMAVIGGGEQRSSDSESQPEKRSADGHVAPDPVTETEYPSGIVLAIIVTALFMAVFLFALDMVSPFPKSLRSGQQLTEPPHRQSWQRPSQK